METIRPSLLFSLSSHYHKTLPMQLYSPIMDMKKLDLRMKQLISSYRYACPYIQMFTCTPALHLQGRC